MYFTTGVLNGVCSSQSGPPGPAHTSQVGPRLQVAQDPQVIRESLGSAFSSSVLLRWEQSLQLIGIWNQAPPHTHTPFSAPSQPLWSQDTIQPGCASSRQACSGDLDLGQRPTVQLPPSGPRPSHWEGADRRTVAATCRCLVHGRGWARGSLCHFRVPVHWGPRAGGADGQGVCTPPSLGS